jgi:hypothetical protein
MNKGPTGRSWEERDCRFCLKVAKSLSPVITALDAAPLKLGKLKPENAQLLAAA